MFLHQQRYASRISLSDLDKLSNILIELYKLVPLILVRLFDVSDAPPVRNKSNFWAILGRIIITFVFNYPVCIQTDKQTPVL